MRRRNAALVGCCYCYFVLALGFLVLAVVAECVSKAHVNDVVEVLMLPFGLHPRSQMDRLTSAACESDSHSMSVLSGTGDTLVRSLCVDVCAFFIPSPSLMPASHWWMRRYVCVS